MVSLRIFFILSGLFLLAGSGCKSHEKVSGQNGDVVSYNTRRTFNQHYYEGSKQKALGFYDEAVSEFKKALELIPSSHATMYQLGNITFKQNKLEEAIHWSEQAVKKNPVYNHWYYGQLAQIYSVARQYDKSAQTFATMVEKDPGRKSNYEEAGNQFLNAGKPKEALKYFEKYLSKYGPSEDVCRKLEGIYLDLNQPADALRIIKKLSDAYPGEVKYLGLLAEIQLKVNKVAEARETYKKIFDLEPGNGFAAFGMADIMRREGNNEESFRYLCMGFSDSKVNIQHKLKVISSYYFLITKDEKSREQAITLSKILLKTHPEDATPYQVYSDMLFSVNQLLESREYLRKGLSIDGRDYRIWQKLFAIDVKLSNNQFLFEDSRDALELFTTLPGLFIIHSTAAARVGEYDRAIETATAGLDISFKSDEQVQLYLTLADAWYGKGDVVKTDLYFSKALEADQQSALALNNYAYNLFKRNTNLAKAEEMVLKAIKLEPNSGSFADTYGCILMAKGNYQDAEVWIKKALELDGENHEVLEHLGDLYQKTGKTDLAAKAYKRALELDPENKSLKKKLIN